MKYTHAIVSRIPDSYSSVIKNDVSKAREEQKRLIEIIRELGVDVLELPPEESSPHSVYVRDLAVIHNGVALMCRPDFESSQSIEIKTIKAVLRKELGQSVLEMTSSNGLLNGSDVLFTGKEFFVGLTNSTNIEGASAVANTWPEYPCTVIKVDDSNTRLQDFLSVVDPDLLLVSHHSHSQSLLKRVEREAINRYSVLTLPDYPDCLYVNGTLIHSSTSKINDVLASKTNFSKVSVPISFLTSDRKPYTGMSSSILLLRKSKYVRRL